jgi:hypothetical protein
MRMCTKGQATIIREEYFLAPAEISFIPKNLRDFKSFYLDKLRTVPAATLQRRRWGPDSVSKGLKPTEQLKSFLTNF